MMSDDLPPSQPAGVQKPRGFRWRLIPVTFLCFVGLTEFIEAARMTLFAIFLNIQHGWIVVDPVNPRATPFALCPSNLTLWQIHFWMGVVATASAWAWLGHRMGNDGVDAVVGAAAQNRVHMARQGEITHTTDRQLQVALSLRDRKAGRDTTPYTIENVCSQSALLSRSDRRAFRTSVGPRSRRCRRGCVWPLSWGGRRVGGGRLGRGSGRDGWCTRRHRSARSRV